MKNIYLIFILLLLTASKIFSQKRANVILWGNGNELNLNTNPPTYSLRSRFFSNFFSTSICDTSGNLVFFSNGSYTYGPNGYLNNDRYKDIFSTRNDLPCLLVNKPGNDSIFYLLTAELPTITYIPSLLWSELNRSTNSYTNNINIPLRDSIAGTIAATMHCNKKDIWIIVHSFEGNKFYAYLLTENGFNPNPVISIAGPPNINLLFDLNNSMKFSPNGKLLAFGHTAVFEGRLLTNSLLELYDFDNSTGKVSNERSYSEINNSACPTFSPNSKVLYVVGSSPLLPRDSFKLFQFDLADNNYNLINPLIIHSFRPSPNPHVAPEIATAQLLGNGKIYCFTNAYWSLYQVNSPDNIGNSCDFQNSQYTLESNDELTNINTVSNYLDSSYSENSLNIISNGKYCSNSSIRFHINNQSAYDSIRWYQKHLSNGVVDSSTGPSAIFNLPADGNMKVTVFAYGHCGTDSTSIIFSISNAEFHFPGDTTLCQDQTLTLNPGVSDASYLWQDNSTLDSFKVSARGDYWVKVTKNGCSYSDSINVNYSTSKSASFGADTSLCSGDTLLLKANIPDAKYLWNTGSDSDSIKVTTTGKYWLKVETGFCITGDTITATFNPIPSFNLGDDTVICESQQLKLNIKVTGAQYLWNNGNTSDNLLVTSPGLYWASIQKSGCSFRDSIYVSQVPKPPLNLGADTAICINSRITLNASSSLIQSYLWNDGSTLPTYLVSQTGKYWVLVKGNNNCYNSDTISIDVSKRPPSFSLGNKTSICPGQNIILDPQINPKDNAFLWQDGSTTSTYKVLAPGKYKLKVANRCGVNSQEILIEPGNCELFMPNAFTPNRDGVNDIFRVKYSSFIKYFSMQIFNKWGQLVFVTRNPQEGWNGKLKGVDQPIGSYVWIIQYTTVENKKGYATGNVLLIR